MKRIGFGQVEPNHLSAKRTGQIYAQLPAAEGIKVLENGQFVKYDYASGKVKIDKDSAGEWMLVFNEVKLYEDRQTYKDFALKTADAVSEEIVPRILKTNIGDIYTTNCVEVGNTNGKDEVGSDEVYEAGNKFVVDENTGYLVKADTPAAGVMVWQVAKVYTLADGQEALKLVRIA
jgi:hypothetical protein